MFILALALALPSNVQGVWAPDQEGCKGRVIVHEGEVLGRDDPIERIFLTDHELIKFEAYGKVLSVTPVGGESNLVEVEVSGEGQTWIDSYLVWRNGEKLMLDNVHDDSEPESFVRC